MVKKILHTMNQGQVELGKRKPPRDKETPSPNHMYWTDRGLQYAHHGITEERRTHVPLIERH